jgi:hypothetical protein
MKKVGIILLGLVLLAFIFWKHASPVASEKAESIACTDITQSCGNAEFSVQFKEAPQVMKPFHLELNGEHIQNVRIREIHASFAMKGMEMGFNRYQLIKVGQAEWKAEVTLPVCVQGRSDWEILLELDTEKGKQRFVVPFSAAKK